MSYEYFLTTPPYFFPTLYIGKGKEGGKAPFSCYQLTSSIVNGFFAALTTSMAGSISPSP